MKTIPSCVAIAMYIAATIAGSKAWGDSTRYTKEYPARVQGDCAQRCDPDIKAARAQLGVYTPPSVVICDVESIATVAASGADCEACYAACSVCRAACKATEQDVHNAPYNGDTFDLDSCEADCANDDAAAAVMEASDNCGRAKSLLWQAKELAPYETVATCTNYCEVEKAHNFTEDGQCSRFTEACLAHKYVADVHDPYGGNVQDVEAVIEVAKLERRNCMEDCQVEDGGALCFESKMFLVQNEEGEAELYVNDDDTFNGLWGDDADDWDWYRRSDDDFGYGRRSDDDDDDDDDRNYDDDDDDFFENDEICIGLYGMFQPRPAGFSVCCNRNCMDNDLIRDGNNDCGDGSDETSPEFQCNITTTSTSLSTTTVSTTTSTRTTTTTSTNRHAEFRETCALCKEKCDAVVDASLDADIDDVIDRHETIVDFYKKDCGSEINLEGFADCAIYRGSGIRPGTELFLDVNDEYNKLSGYFHGEDSENHRSHANYTNMTCPVRCAMLAEHEFYRTNFSYQIYEGSHAHVNTLCTKYDAIVQAAMSVCATSKTGNCAAVEQAINASEAHAEFIGSSLTPSPSTAAPSAISLSLIVGIGVGVLGLLGGVGIALACRTKQQNGNTTAEALSTFDISFAEEGSEPEPEAKADEDEDGGEDAAVTKKKKKKSVQEVKLDENGEPIKKKASQKKKKAEGL